jgi:response regulator RpfG family c-di-GMP phosphodiesterase
MKTILVLEDDPSNMRAFTTLLWSSGYRVLQAETGKEAIKVGKCHHGPIDLFLSDVDVPELSGTAVALELIKAYPAMRFLFVSGTPMDIWGRNDLENFGELPSHLVDFLEKPFRLSTFLDKIDELIERRVKVRILAPT